MIKPSGYKLQKDDYHLPKFYYIHKEFGSPKALRYPGAEKTGKLPKYINFGLMKSDENESFRALVFGDPQTYTQQEISYFKKGVINDIRDTTGLSFGISLGDLVGDDLSLHPYYKETVAAIGLPWYNVMGNHDMNYDVESDSLSDETYERNFGPANYSFNYGNAHFIVLDDIIYPHPITKKGYWGGFREDQLKFVENDLKFVPKEKLIVIAYHIPLFLNDKTSEHFRPEDRQKLLDLLKPFQNTLSLSAHTHFQTQVFIDKNDGFNREKPHHEFNVGTTSGDWYSGRLSSQDVPVATMRDGTPKGYLVLNVSDNQYTFDYKVVGQDQGYQIKLMAPEKIESKHSGRYNLYANFFIGSERDSVKYRFDGGKWNQMHRVDEVDPDYAYELGHYDHTNETSEIAGRRPSDAVTSTHLWKIRFPKMKSGKHTFEVVAKDMFGREYTAEKTVTVI